MLDSAQTREIINTLQSLITISGIIWGGIWSYTLFIKKRQKYPRAEITHAITHRPFAAGKTLISIDVTVKNNGDVLLRLASSLTQVKHMRPASPALLADLAEDDDPVAYALTTWAVIAEKEEDWRQGILMIEPGECQSFHYDFPIAATIQTVLVFSYLERIFGRFEQLLTREPSSGWYQNTVYDLDAGPTLIEAERLPAANAAITERSVSQCPTI